MNYNSTQHNALSSDIENMGDPYLHQQLVDEIQILDNPSDEHEFSLILNIVLAEIDVSGNHKKQFLASQIQKA